MGLARTNFLIINAAWLLLLFSTPLYAGNSIVAIPLFDSEIIPQKNIPQSFNSSGKTRLQLASISIDGDKDDDKDKDRECERRNYRGKCKPIKKLKVRNLHKLQFGETAPNRSGGTRVVIEPRTGSKKVFKGVNLGGEHGPAEFELKGQPNKRFVVDIPEKIVLQGKAGRGPRVSKFTAYLASNNRSKHSKKRKRQLIGHLGRDGKAKLLIGGTLFLKKGRMTGKFKAPCDVFVEYLP